MTDHAQAAQRAAEAHLAACHDYLMEEDLPEPDTAGPFCGCITCEVREVLHAAYPHLARMWEEEERERE